MRKKATQTLNKNNKTGIVEVKKKKRENKNREKIKSRNLENEKMETGGGISKAKKAKA